MPEPSYRHLTSRSDGDVLVLTLTDLLLLDEEVVEGAHADLVAAVERHQPRKVVLDLQHVRAMGSAAFRPVISLHRRLREAGGELILCGLTDAVANIFHLTGLISRIPAGRAPLASEADVRAAVARLAGPGDRPAI
jgi:anti-anti-sigma factor